MKLPTGAVDVVVNLRAVTEAVPTAFNDMPYTAIPVWLIVNGLVAKPAVTWAWVSEGAVHV